MNVPLPRQLRGVRRRRTGDPVLVDLGPAAAIDAAVEKFRKALADPTTTKAPRLGNALYDLTMAKIEPAARRRDEPPDRARWRAQRRAVLGARRRRNEFLIKRTRSRT